MLLYVVLAVVRFLGYVMLSYINLGWVWLVFYYFLFFRLC
jgi:hypothetical protein